jgi:hypothetical protein
MPLYSFITRPIKRQPVERPPVIRPTPSGRINLGEKRFTVRVIAPAGTKAPETKAPGPTLGPLASASLRVLDRRIKRGKWARVEVTADVQGTGRYVVRLYIDGKFYAERKLARGKNRVVFKVPGEAVGRHTITAKIFEIK